MAQLRWRLYDIGGSFIHLDSLPSHLGIIAVLLVGSSMYLAMDSRTELQVRVFWDCAFSVYSHLQAGSPILKDN